MADNKKQSYKALKTFACLCGVAAFGQIIEEAERTIQTDKQPIVGKEVVLNYNAPAYPTIYDAINGTNKKERCFDEKCERQVIAAFYEFNEKIIKIDMYGNYTLEEQKIIDSNGKIVGVITTVDLDKKTPEAFYSANDVQRKLDKTKKIS